MIIWLIILGGLLSIAYGVWAIADVNSRDAGTQRMQEMAPLIQQYQRAEKALRVQGQGGNDPRMEEFRWMLEELRIALFAQELRTPVPMSVKRLQKVWESMQR